MNTAIDSPRQTDQDADRALAALKWQVASARAATAKHRARFIDQLTHVGDRPRSGPARPIG